MEPNASHLHRKCSRPKPHTLALFPHSFCLVWDYTWQCPGVTPSSVKMGRGTGKGDFCGANIKPKPWTAIPVLSHLSKVKTIGLTDRPGRESLKFSRLLSELNPLCSHLHFSPPKPSQPNRGDPPSWVKQGRNPSSWGFWDNPPCEVVVPPILVCGRACCEMFWLVSEHIRHSQSRTAANAQAGVEPGGTDFAIGPVGVVIKGLDVLRWRVVAYAGGRVGNSKPPPRCRAPSCTGPCPDLWFQDCPSHPKAPCWSDK